MKLIPQSLVGRITLWIIGVSILTLVVNLVLLQFIWMRPFGKLALQTLAGRIVAMRAAIEATPAAARPALLARFSDENFQLHAQAPAPVTREHSLAPRPQIELLRAAAGPDVDVEFGRGDERRTVVLSFEAAGARYWMSSKVDPLGQAVPQTLAIWLALLGIVAVLALGFGARLMARPLRQIADALGEGRSELVLVPIPDGAGSEIRQVVDRYNRLVRAVVAEHQARDQLLAGVSHDLRTPLARARLRAETTLPEDEARRFVADLDAVDRVIGQFLAYVRQSQEPQIGTPAPLHDTVQRVLMRYRNAGDEIGGHVDAVPLHLPDTATDRLLSNLIENAFTYGEPPVEVDVRASGHAVELAVSDAGSGMDEEQFRRALMPFVRLDHSRGQLGHCGLGLAIVKHIADRLQARLSVQRGAGTRFEVVVAFALPPARAVSLQSATR
jgi:two-component system osmolarity sensor histidine kinase EnvZ